jgi:hypothetical protein
MRYFITILIIVVVLKLAIEVLKAFEHSPKGRGIIGEWYVNRKIKRKLKKSEKLIKNFRFTTKDGKTVQIDHIVIKHNGFFVIETKNYVGYIRGKENEFEWTQIPYSKRRNNKFYNPLKQNKSHIYYLKELINEDVEYKSLVVFPKANISNVTYIPGVCNMEGLKVRLLKDTDPYFTDEQIENLYQKLIEKNEKIKTKDHIKNIENMKEQIDNDICPRCGSKLVVRYGKYGNFKGCSSYPNCKFKKKL